MINRPIERTLEQNPLARQLRRLAETVEGGKRLLPSQREYWDYCRDDDLRMADDLLVKAFTDGHITGEIAAAASSAAAGEVNATAREHGEAESVNVFAWHILSGWAALQWPHEFRVDGSLDLCRGTLAALLRKAANAISVADRTTGPTISITAAAARLSTNERNVRRWCEEKRPPCHNATKRGGTWSIPEADIPMPD